MCQACRRLPHASKHMQPHSRMHRCSPAHRSICRLDQASLCKFVHEPQQSHGYVGFVLGGAFPLCCMYGAGRLMWRRDLSLQHKPRCALACNRQIHLWHRQTWFLKKVWSPSSRKLFVCPKQLDFHLLLSSVAVDQLRKP